MEKLDLQRVTRFFRTLFSARRWQRFWAKDWVLKAVSLVLATMLWYFVVGEDTVDKNVMVPIEIINLPRDLVISNQFKKEIEVTVSGPRSMIQDLANRKVSRQIDLANATPGTNVIENTNDSLQQVPRGVSVLRIQPSSLILSLDKLIQKKFPIQPVTTGEVANGFLLQRLGMDPEVITITGPQTILSQVDELRTRIIDINGMVESRQLQVPLDLDPNIVELIGETSVTAEIEIRPKMVQRRFTAVPVDVREGNQMVRLEPTVVDVVVNIPLVMDQEDKEYTDFFSITAFAEENEDVLRVKVIPNADLDLPLEIIAISPPEVTVKRPRSNASRDLDSPVNRPGAVADSPAKMAKESDNEKEEGRGEALHISADKNKIIIRE